MAGFVGHNGNNVWLDPAQGREDDDPVVVDHPEHFTDMPPPGVDPPKRKPGRPFGSKNQPKTDQPKPASPPPGGSGVTPSDDGRK
jgi:hypothetical protein